MRTSRWIIALTLVAIASVAFIRAQGHAMQNVADAKWGPAPPMLPKGAEIAVLSGDPTQSGPYAVRLRFPANYDIPAHAHPTDENVVVTSGSLYLGMGDKLDRTKAAAFTVGGFAIAPANLNHFAFTKAATTVVLYGQGPVEFKYVNPADDPRTKK
jgi:quercetin dioxygenase-like cupin family protein